MKRLQFNKAFIISIIIFFIVFIVIIATRDSLRSFDFSILYLVGVSSGFWVSIFWLSIIAFIVLLFVRKTRKFALGVLIFWIIVFACQLFYKSGLRCGGVVNTIDKNTNELVISNLVK